MKYKKYKRFILSFIIFFVITFLILILSIFSIKTYCQTLTLNQSFGIIFLYNDSNILFGAIESSNLVAKYRESNFIFFSSIYFYKYELGIHDITNKDYDFILNYIWIRIPINFISFDFGVKPELDIEQGNLDLFSPYFRMVIQNIIGSSNSLNRWQISLKYFVSDFSVLSFKWYLTDNFSLNSDNIFYLNFYSFIEPFQIEVIGIYYEFTQKSRIGLSIKFPLLINWSFSGCLHFDSNMKYRYYETKIQISYNLPKIFFYAFWYHTSFVFSELDFMEIILNHKLLTNLDELLSMDNNIFGLSITFNPDPFLSIYTTSIFLIEPFDLLSILGINFNFSNTLKLKISYIFSFKQDYILNNTSTISKYIELLLLGYKGLLAIELSFIFI